MLRENRRQRKVVVKWISTTMVEEGSGETGFCVVFVAVFQRNSRCVYEGGSGWIDCVWIFSCGVSGSCWGRMGGR